MQFPREGALAETTLRFSPPRSLRFALGFAIVGCATISESVERREVSVGNDRVQKQVVNGSLRYSATVRTGEQSIIAALIQSEDCQTTRSERLHRTDVTTRTITGGLRPWLSLSIGSLLTSAGVVALIAPQQVAAAGSSSASPGTVQLSGILTGLGGLTLLTIGIIDLIRSRDTEEDLGIVNRPSVTQTVVCNRGPVPETSAVRLQLGRRELKAHPLGGYATFSMRDVAADDLPLARDELVLTVLRTPVVVPFPEHERKELERQLARDPTTALSLDMAARQVGACSTALEEANKLMLTPSSSDTSADRAIQNWERARATCGALWNSETDAQQVAALGSLATPTARRVESVTSTLGSRGKQLDAKPSVTAAAGLDAALTAANEAKRRCSSLSELLKELDQPCERLERAIVSAQATLEVHADKVEQLRIAAAEREGKKRDAAAAKSWRAHFAKCRTLATAQEKVTELDLRGQCVGECVKAAGKMRDEADRLAAFEADPPSDGEILTALRYECESAGCSSCP